MKKKIKHTRNIRKMTKLQYYIFDSQSERKGKQIRRNYHAKVFWHIGRYGGNRYRNVAHAYTIIPYEELFYSADNNSRPIKQEIEDWLSDLTWQYHLDYQHHLERM